MSDPRIVCPNCSASIRLTDTVVAPLIARTHAVDGRRTKMEIVYQYLTGPQFRQHIDAIVEKFCEMRSDLDRERRATMRLWAKREAQLNGVIFEGRGWRGFHHHATLCIAAYGFLISERETIPPSGAGRSRPIALARIPADHRSRGSAVADPTSYSKFDRDDAAAARTGARPHPGAMSLLCDQLRLPPRPSFVTQ